MGQWKPTLLTSTLCTAELIANVLSSVHPLSTFHDQSISLRSMQSSHKQGERTHLSKETCYMEKLSLK